MEGATKRSIGYSQIEFSKGCLIVFGAEASGDDHGGAPCEVAGMRRSGRRHTRKGKGYIKRERATSDTQSGYESV